MLSYFLQNISKINSITHIYAPDQKYPCENPDFYQSRSGKGNLIAQDRCNQQMKGPLAHTFSLFNDHVPFLFHCANKLKFCPPEYLSPPVHARVYFSNISKSMPCSLQKGFPSSSGPAKLQIRI